MCLISVKPIHRPRQDYPCDSGLSARCRGKCLGAYVRLYGAGNHGDPPYVMRICIDCAHDSAEPRIRDAGEQLA